MLTDDSINRVEDNNQGKSIVKRGNDLLIISREESEIN